MAEFLKWILNVGIFLAIVYGVYRLWWKPMRADMAARHGGNQGASGGAGQNEPGGPRPPAT